MKGNYLKTTVLAFALAVGLGLMASCGGDDGGGGGGGGGVCTDQCTTVGEKQCSGDGYQTCYDAGNCLKWSAVTACNAGETCTSGVCSGGGAVELLTNGDFAAGNLNGWIDESSGPGLASGVVSFVDDSPQTSALELNSLAGSNYYMEYAQYIPVSSLSDLSMTFSWKWKQNSIGATWGVAEVWLFFNKTPASTHYGKQGDATTTIGGILYAHQTGSFYTCSASFSFLAANQRYCSLPTGASFPWGTQPLDLKSLLDTSLAGVDQSQIQSVKVLITSYNNAGEGADALWDDISLRR